MKKGLYEVTFAPIEGKVTYAKFIAWDERGAMASAGKMEAMRPRPDRRRVPVSARRVGEIDQ